MPVWDLNPDPLTLFWVFFPLIPHYGHINNIPAPSELPREAIQGDTGAPFCR